MVRATPRIVMIALCTLLAVEGAAAATCTITQYVRSNVCTTCPTGYARAAGDDSTGADTACLLCAEGYYVSATGADANTAGTCTKCAGSSSTSPTDSTSAGTALTASSCTAKTCAANQYVNAKTCKDCPTGYTSTGGDPSTGSDTHCTKCADGYFVSALGSSGTTPGTCTACDTGLWTAGEESHSGGSDFADKDVGCLKTAPGYFLKTKGGSGTSAGSEVEACATGYTTDGELDAATGGTDGLTAATGCLKTAPGYFLKTKGGSGTNAGSEVEACATGYTTDGGLDAATGGTDGLTAETGCLLVAANYYVSAVGASATKAGTVTACPSGSTNAEGDTSIGGTNGVLSECDTAAKVVTGSKCADAAYGLVNAGCVACAADNYVSAKGADVILAGTCTACAAGSTNAAGDVSTTSTTTCDTTACAANEYVSSNACTACAAGTTNAAGDAATGANTACDKTTCAADQHVKTNVCTECEGTSINEAGDDASGADTECDLVSVSGASHSVVKATTTISFLMLGFLALAM